MCMGALPTFICVNHACGTIEASRGHKIPLGLEAQVVLSYLMGVGN